MSSGPLSDLINAQQGGPPAGLAPPGLVGGVNGNVAQLGPSNTGAGQFLGGPLTPADFRIGAGPRPNNPFGGIGAAASGTGNVVNQAIEQARGQPTYNPNARPEMGGLLGRLR